MVLLGQDIKNYKQQTKHASVIGLIDPTGCIPKGKVFIPGMGRCLPQRVFITRSPCREASHGRVVDVANLPPHAWEFFDCVFDFGCVVFARDHEDPLPVKLANGDLGKPTVLELSLYFHFVVSYLVFYFKTETGTSFAGMSKS